MAETDYVCDVVDDATVRGAVRSVFGASGDAVGTAICALRDDQMVVTVISGGITNQLRRVKFEVAERDKTAIPSSVLVRVFGGETVVDRSVENPMFKAIAGYLGRPAYWGRFGNGRIEGWLDGMRPMMMRPTAGQPVFDMARMAEKVAQRIAQFHKIPDSVYPRQPDSQLWVQLWAWFDSAASKEVGDKIRAEPANPMQSPSGAIILDELKLSDPATRVMLERLQKQVPESAPVVFCHNDVLSGNIMINDDTDDVCLIDFEYGSTNYRGFDIANHFNEYGGGSDDGFPDYTNFPTPGQQAVFCKAYLAEMTGSEASVADVAGLVAETEIFVKINHWYWGLWAVIQAADEGTAGFPYMSYAKNRIGEFHKNEASLSLAGGRGPRPQSPM